jgi:hypothetical protein
MTCTLPDEYIPAKLFHKIQFSNMGTVEGYEQLQNDALVRAKLFHKILLSNMGTVEGGGSARK